MKITKIRLASHLHFKKGLEILLTYPTAHPKAGEPLDKICFIGQSGTGKTTLLNIVKYFACEDLPFNRSGIDETSFTEGGVELFYKIDGGDFSKRCAGEGRFSHFNCSDPSHPKLIDYVKPWKETLDHLLKNCAPLLINFPFCVVNPEDVEKGPGTFNKETGSLESVPPEASKVWDFDPSTIRSVWNIVFRKVERYRTEYKAKVADHFRKMHAQTEDSVSIMKDFKEWEQSHPNPLQELADGCLNEILKHFNLEVETDLLKYESEGQPSNEERMQVIVKDKTTGRPISYQFLSTGTKQILLTAIPLFYLEPRNSIILFDQPETSLYPNVQLMLPEIYSGCGEANSQFFFATHSPIVASAFDPWEIVQLEFAEDGSVSRKEYFTGNERSVGNYRIQPKLLRWDSNYKILFDVKVESNEERTEKLMELADLERRIKAANDEKEKAALFADYQMLSERLDWHTR